jgi:microcystin degradation protein MlrC
VSPKRTRLATARLWFEGCSFTPVATTLNEFRAREWVTGEAARAFYRGTRTEMGAVVDFLDAHPAWDGVIGRCAAASPGGPIVEADLQTIFGEILAHIEQAHADAVYLSLHGACIGEQTLCADRALLQAVRKLIGSRPLAVSFDLHANVPEDIASSVDILVGYHTHPHVDMYETATRALTLLERMVSGAINPRVAVRKVGAVLPSLNMRTAAGPMAEMEALAAAPHWAKSGVLDITPFGGFAYADTPCAGASVVAVADGDRQAAQQAADVMVQEMRQRVPQFAVLPYSPADAIARARELLAMRQSRKPIAITEPSDNPFSGGAGDTPGLLRALADHADDLDVLFAFFWEPQLAARCHAAGVGARMDIALGARLAGWYGEPVTLTVEVAALSNGRFRNHGPMEAGLAMDIGPAVLLRTGKLGIIVSSGCQTPNDAAYLELFGIDLAQIDILAVKAKNHFRAAFTPLCEAILDADTPGPAMADMAKLPFRNLLPELMISIGLPPTPR